MCVRVRARARVFSLTFRMFLLERMIQGGATVRDPALFCHPMCATRDGSAPGIEGGVHSYERVAHLQCAGFCIDRYQL